MMTEGQIVVKGVGSWGRKRIIENRYLARTTANDELFPIAENSPTILDQCQKEFGKLDYRLDYRTLLSEKEINAAHICTPHASHYEDASSFLKEGKNALVEKSLTLNPAKAYKIKDLARETTQVVCT